MSTVYIPMLSFTDAAKTALADTQLRRNLGKATQTIRTKRAEVVHEMEDWQGLREAGRAIKERTLRHLDHYLLELEQAVQQAGGHVHWARDAAEACQIVTRLVQQHETSEVVKVKSMTTEEIGLNEALAEAQITAFETDLAELIIQLANEKSSHILVPAIHKNRSEIREIFLDNLAPEHVEGLTDVPADLARAARSHLRQKFLSAKVAISGANFAVAETGTVCVVESEGNGRMCLTLPPVLISVMGIEKLIPTWQDFEVFMQLLPRSSTGERMNPYTTFWTGVAAGDGPQEFHLVLLDNGRINTLADEIGRQALNCIRCSACLNICPVYERTGGHAYNSVYPGPIGAILTPQLVGTEHAASLPFASSLCGACYEVCPVKINIPEVLVHLRAKVVRQHQKERRVHTYEYQEGVVMKALSYIFSNRRRYEAAQRLALIGQWPFVHDGKIDALPAKLSGWTTVRDLRPVPKQSFRDWWRKRQAQGGSTAEGVRS
ncbi:MAG: iron-sulfur cluster-binding protein [Chloroflexaceae bacterium]|nr:iron-sulfur cluster-binding protein [Chloroflexaceae bacterium]